MWGKGTNWKGEQMNIWGDGNVLYSVFSGSYLSTFIKCTICGEYICYIYAIIKIHLIM